MLLKNNSSEESEKVNAKERACFSLRSFRCIVEDEEVMHGVVTAVPCSLSQRRSGYSPVSRTAGLPASLVDGEEGGRVLFGHPHTHSC